MPRPQKCRKLAFLPGVTYYKPAGIPMRYLEEIRISFDEFEAIRLKDLEGLEQEQGAEKMEISRPTFQRILSSARKKLADALCNGKALRVEGGNFELMKRKFRCCKGHEWEMKSTGELPLVCPTCSTSEITPLITEKTVDFRGRGCARLQSGE
jgi:uncharacterized protein